MRRTQQNADQQRRRGVRSRLVACVAAVAMLVTSVAAGTAVAAELGGGDAADQTTQNTATLEQQGTDNTGDNNQTTTDDDGQADGNQSADADSGSEGDEGAADNGAADGAGTAESDVQSQGDAASKSANAVPAPQSADADANADAGVSAQAMGPEYTGDPIFTQDFLGAVVQDSNWLAFGDACLTAAATVTTQGGDGRQLGGCLKQSWHRGEDHTNGTSSLSGQPNGALQLTDNHEGRNGTVLYNQDLPISEGLDITFTQYQVSNGSNHGIGKADGIGFYLTAGNTELIEPGPQGSQVGGALGYSTYEGESGIANAVLGLGLDVYGNFSTSNASGNGCYDGATGTRQENSVVLRGEGNGTVGYCLVGTNQVDSSELQTGLPTVGNAYTNNPTGNDGTVVRIIISPQGTGKNDYSTVTVYLNGVERFSRTLSYKLPDTVKFGFSSSTGQGYQAHLIRGLSAYTVNKTTGIILEKQIDGDRADLVKNVYQVGDEVPYRFTVTNSGSSTITSFDLLDDHLNSVQCDATSLEPRTGTVCRGTYTLQSSDVSSDGTFTNHAEVEGHTVDGNIVTDADDETVPVIGALAHRKWIEKKNGDNDEYTLNLNVTGDTVTSTTETGETAKVDVVFVLDTSGSMQGTRLQQLKNAITGESGLSSVLYGNKQLDVVSNVIEFNDNAYVVGADLTAKDDLDRVVNQLSADGGTQWGEGLAAVFGNDVATREDAQKYAIFLTDGDPGSNGRDDGFWTDEDSAIKAYNMAVSQGRALASAGWNILNVGVDMPDQKVWVNPNVDSVSRTWNGGIFGSWEPVGYQYTNRNGWVTPLAALTAREQAAKSLSSSQLIQFTNTDSGNLAEVFKDLGSIITTSTTYRYGNVVIADDISQWAEVIGIQRNGDTVTGGVQVIRSDTNRDVAKDSNIMKGISFDGNELVVTFADGYQLEDGVTYTVKFDVKPTAAAYDQYRKNLNAGQSGDDLYRQDDGSTQRGEPDTGDTSADKAGFYSNDEATVSYALCSTVDKGESTCGSQEEPLVYNKPVLQVTVKDVTLDGSAFVTVRKTVSGRPWRGGESFTFNLTADTENAPMPVDDQGQEQSSITLVKPVTGSTNTGVFDKIIYTSSGTYKYTLEEVVPESSDERHGLTYSKAEYEVTVTVPEDMSQPKVDVRQSLDDEGNATASGAVAGAEAVFINSLAPYTYTVDEHLKLHKQLDGLGLESGMFDFTLSAVAVDDKGELSLADTVNGMSLPERVNVSNGDEDGDGSVDDNASVFDFGTITFSKPGTYYVRVVENKDAKPESGYYVFDKHALYVRYEVTVNQNGELDVTRSVATYVPTDDAPDPVNENLTWTSEQDGAIPEETLTWHNTYVAPVSALPLTGGDSTARTLLLAGGGVLLLAGVAWLLARRRRV